MSRRSVVRCDECGRDEDMRPPPWMASTSSSLGPDVPFFRRSMNPLPPEGWFERYAGLQGAKDFCSATCVSAWDACQPRGVQLA